MKNYCKRHFLLNVMTPLQPFRSIGSDDCFPVRSDKENSTCLSQIFLLFPEYKVGIGYGEYCNNQDREDDQPDCEILEK